MRLLALKQHINTAIFTNTDLAKLFPEESGNQINTQVYRMIKRGDLIGIKRGIYLFPEVDIDEFVIANRIYTPSYVSLESALNIYGIIPDYASNITSITTTTTKNIKTQKNTFLYSKISRLLYFGFENVIDSNSGLYYQLALPEKALLDYIYIRKIKSLSENRVDTSGLNEQVFANFAVHFPKWVSKVITSE